jgi:hypothetical protein
MSRPRWEGDVLPVALNSTSEAVAAARGTPGLGHVTKVQTAAATQIRRNVLRERSALEHRMPAATCSEPNRRYALSVSPGRARGRIADRSIGREFGHRFGGEGRLSGGDEPP